MTCYLHAKREESCHVSGTDYEGGTGGCMRLAIDTLFTHFIVHNTDL